MQQRAIRSEKGLFFVGQEQPPRIFSIFQKVSGEASFGNSWSMHEAGGPWRPKGWMPPFMAVELLRDA
jgi:hypothetical protein